MGVVRRLRVVAPDRHVRCPQQPKACLEQQAVHADEEKVEGVVPHDAQLRRVQDRDHRLVAVDAEGQAQVGQPRRQKPVAERNALAQGRGGHQSVSNQPVGGDAAGQSDLETDAGVAGEADGGSAGIRVKTGRK